MKDSSGELAAALANEIVGLMAEYTGRGSPKSRCHVHEDLVVCVLHDSLTKGELSLVRDGKEEAVLAIRRSYQESMRSQLIEIVERLTGRKVAAFMSSNHVHPDIAIESFVLELLDVPAATNTTHSPRRPLRAAPPAP
jgi:uncharacterized protein YbcI